MSWEERRLLYIPELWMSYNSAWGSLKKTWRRFKIAKAQWDGDECIRCLERVRELREGMGLEDEETCF
ncbi:MAG: hypothetical protein WBZ36_21510 [Candidatus Nitrosopolaris sp.]